jgi:serine/threonine protein kinase
MSIPASFPPPPPSHLPFPAIDSLIFGRCLGSGHFSHVYEGIFRGHIPAAIKLIERGSERVVDKEIRLLLKLRNQPYIVQLYEVIRSESTLLVFELFPSLSIRDFFSQITLNRFRYVLRCLLIALRSAHQIGIIHRDVTLSNILISPNWQNVRLADWGCGSEISDHMSYRAGSRPLRSIEMLLHIQNYGSCGDMWAVGVLIFNVLCRGDLPWRCETGWETLVEIAGFVGRRATVKLARKYGAELPEDVLNDIYRVPRRKFSDCFAEPMKSLQEPELINLMEKLLEIRMEERLTAEEALGHSFFIEK